MALPFLALSDVATQFLDGVRCRYRSFAQCYLTWPPATFCLQARLFQATVPGDVQKFPARA